MLYCIYDTLNMFRALLCPSSGALDYMHAIAAYGVQCLAAGCRGSGAGQPSVRPGSGMLHECSRSASLFLDAHTAALHHIPVNQRSSTAHSLELLMCPKYVERIINSIKHTVTSSWFFLSTHMQRCTDKHTSGYSFL